MTVSQCKHTQTGARAEERTLDSDGNRVIHRHTQSSPLRQCFYISTSVPALPTLSPTSGCPWRGATAVPLSAPPAVYANSPPAAAGLALQGTMRTSPTLHPRRRPRRPRQRRHAGACAAAARAVHHRPRRACSQTRRPARAHPRHSRRRPARRRSHGGATCRV